MIPTKLILGSLGNIFALVFCLGYAIYIFLKKGVYVKHKGWQTKDEAPKTFYFTIGIMILISILSLGAIIFRLYTYYFV